MIRRAAWVLLLLLVCCGQGAGRARDVKTQRPADGRLRSNILRGDYAGSAACAGCHDDIYQAFMGSPMHKMTRRSDDLPDSEVRAPFTAATTYHFKDDSATLSEGDDRTDGKPGRRRFLRVQSPRFGEHLYRVTKIIGGRSREDFAGVEVAVTQPASAQPASAQQPGTGASPRQQPDELILPLSYVFSTQSFRLKGYSVMATERPGLRAGAVWNRTCVFCHNTSPYLTTVYGALLGAGAPGYQGEVVDALLPAGRRFAFTVRDPALLAEALRAEIHFLGGSAPDAPNANDAPDNGSGLLNRALRTTRDRLRDSHLLEIGIGCESCHGGSKEHVKDYRKLPTFEVRSAFLSAGPALLPGQAAERTVSKAEWINRTCARCHQVLFSRYPFTWEGGKRSLDAGGSHINSGEARDFLLGGCAGALSCVACHDPHAEDRPEKLQALAGPVGNALCVKCHPRYGDAQALRDHAHHDPQGAGGACINCHMPRKNMGLSYNLGRYHRIGSPTDQARVAGDRPLECALCHGDKSVEELVTTMERWWGRTYDRAALRVLYGDLRDNALVTTLLRGKGHEQAVAMALLGERKDATGQSALPYLIDGLTNPYPLLRYYAQQALTALTGKACDIDLNQDDAQIRAQARCYQEHRLK